MLEGAICARCSRFHATTQGLGGVGEKSKSSILPAAPVPKKSPICRHLATKAAKATDQLRVGTRIIITGWNGLSSIEKRECRGRSACAAKRQSACRDLSRRSCSLEHDGLRGERWFPVSLAPPVPLAGPSSQRCPLCVFSRASSLLFDGAAMSQRSPLTHYAISPFCPTSAEGLQSPLLIAVCYQPTLDQ